MSHTQRSKPRVNPPKLVVRRYRSLGDERAERVPIDVRRRRQACLEGRTARILFSAGNFEHQRFVGSSNDAGEGA
jgi:hypothetical protein